MTKKNSLPLLFSAVNFRETGGAIGKIKKDYYQNRNINLRRFENEKIDQQTRRCC